MKFGVCSFSGQNIYRGKGRIVVLPNGLSFLFAKKKCRGLFEKGMNPKKINWTLTSRISKKKAVAFKPSKVSVPKITKSVRAFVGLSLEDLKKKMSVKKVEKTPSIELSKRDKIKSIAKK